MTRTKGAAWLFWLAVPAAVTLGCSGALSTEAIPPEIQCNVRVVWTSAEILENNEWGPDEWTFTAEFASGPELRSPPAGFHWIDQIPAKVRVNYVMYDGPVGVSLLPNAVHFQLEARESDDPSPDDVGTNAGWFDSPNDCDGPRARVIIVEGGDSILPSGPVKTRFSFSLNWYTGPIAA